MKRNSIVAIASLFILFGIVHVNHLESEQRHITYIKCVADGIKPMQCTFRAAFKGNNK